MYIESVLRLQVFLWCITIMLFFVLSSLYCGDVVFTVTLQHNRF